MAFQNRIESLCDLMAENRVPLVAVNAGSSLTYLTGMSFHISERPAILFIPSDGLPCFFFPEFEREKFNRAGLDLRTFPYPEDPAQWPVIVSQLIDSITCDKEVIAIAPEEFRFLEMHLIQQAAPKVTFSSAAGLFKSLLVIKDNQEQAAIRNAVAIAEKAFRQTFPGIRPGRTETEIANQLFIHLLEQGSAAELPFSPIVASGPNSADPHAMPGSRTLQAGDLIVIDWGACWDGYISDITRTVCLGEPSHQAVDIAELVEAANQAGRSKAGPGIPACDVDAAARNVIAAEGYGENFIHRTGHGIGLKAHEEPYISSVETNPLAAGMTFTVEPGIYLPGWGGVRIEDNVLITSAGADTLTTLPRELWIVPA
jgi:Xaa-Pro dipeptidase